MTTNNDAPTTSNDEIDIFLVWQPGPPKPYATIEYGRVKNGNGKTDTSLQHHKITTDELGLSLSELMTRYPYHG